MNELLQRIMKNLEWISLGEIYKLGYYLFNPDFEKLTTMFAYLQACQESRVTEATSNQFQFMMNNNTCHIFLGPYMEKVGCQSLDRKTTALLLYF